MSDQIQTLNGDLSVRVCVDTQKLEWSASPSGTVWRKRVHLVGPPESGQVTSVVRYEAGAKFPSHDHPGGEEILVLEGVFSDEHGDWPAGTYLLNPEGFTHSPFSEGGCTLFVKLRQYPGTDRQHAAIPTADMPWQPSVRKISSWKKLYAQEPYTDFMRLEAWDIPAELGQINFPQGAELFVVKGQFTDDSGSYDKHTWIRLPPGASITPTSDEYCELYIKEGGFAYLDGSD
ncbi:MAG: cupin domain-containing protein [Halioglobus sp.]